VKRRALAILALISPLVIVQAQTPAPAAAITARLEQPNSVPLQAAAS